MDKMKITTIRLPEKYLNQFNKMYGRKLNRLIVRVMYLCIIDKNFFDKIFFDDRISDDIILNF